MVGTLELGQRADHTHPVKPSGGHVRCAASIEELTDFGLAAELAVAQRSHIDEVDARAPVAKWRNERRKPWPKAEVNTIVGHLRALHESSRNPEVLRIAPDGEAAQLPHPREAAVRADDKPGGDGLRPSVFAE